MADIQGVEGVINLFNLSGAKNFAIYDVFKQNKLALFKAEANTTAELIEKFKEFAKSLSNRNYDIVIVKDNEKIKFTFSNNTNNTMQNNNDVAKLNDVLNEIAELKSKLQEKQTNTNIDYTQLIEYKIENKFLKEQNDNLKKELEDLQVYVDELEIQLKTLSDKLQNDDKFLKYYNLFKDDKNKSNETNKAVVNDNVSNHQDNDKKNTIKEFLKVITQNFTIVEIKKLTEKLKDKNTISQIKNFLL